MGGKNILLEYTLFGTFDKEKIAIERLKMFEPPEGYYLAFSGGKDSMCIYDLAVRAGVKFTAYYNVTTVDPPELVYFIREHYPDVVFTYPEYSMWQIIVQHKFPPTSRIRYCCEELKEVNGEDSLLITGVRWDESVRRKKSRSLLEGDKKHYNETYILNNDNVMERKLVESCSTYKKRVLNPIIDWTTEEVWEYIRKHHLLYCSLYDEGFLRLGCIGCPLAGGTLMKADFARFPKYKAAYLRAFDRMIQARVDSKLDPIFKNAQHVLDWWVRDCILQPKYPNNQLMLEEYKNMEV